MNKLFVLLLVVFSSASLHGQYMEVGIMSGMTNYKGDLQSRSIEPSEIHLSYGAFARYNFSKYFAVRLQGAYGKVSGSDANHRANNPLRNRNLSFESSIIEASLIAEVNVFGFDVRAEKGSSIFVFGGVGALKFNPKAELLGIMYDLQPLGTEGQNQSTSNYSLLSAAFPVGIGAKLAISEKLNVSLEYGLRFTLTDYLDDVSTGIDPIAASLAYRALEVDPNAPANPFGQARGDASKNDNYMILGFTLSYNLASREKMEYDDSYNW